MGSGIIVCGLNGAGKSTLARALAERLSFHLIDNEDLYFPKTNSSYPYASARTPEEAESLLLHEIAAHRSFVFAAVTGSCESLIPLLRCAVWLEVPKDIRMRRVRERSFQKFGSRMLPGGDLYEREERFFEQVQSRREDSVAQWVGALRCPVLRIDGTVPVEDSLDMVIRWVRQNPAVISRQDL